MLKQSTLEKYPLKLILAVLIILEVACIAYAYSIKFDDYVSFVTIILSLFIAYFGTHYLIHRYRVVGTFEAGSQKTKDFNDETRIALDKLMGTPQFKQYERQKLNRVGLEEADKCNKETEEVIQLLEQLQEKIFDD